MSEVYFIDTNIFMYASGRGHPLKQPCMRIVRGIASRKISAVTSTEVVQEILHRYIALGKREIAVNSVKGIVALLSPLLAISEEIVLQASKLILEYPSLNARDALHIATMLENNLTHILSVDSHFDLVKEVTRCNPADFTMAR